MPSSLGRAAAAIGAGRHDGDPVRRHTVIGDEAARGGRTRRHDAAGKAEGRLFACSQCGGLVRTNSISSASG